jgi:HlyD family secretion protein
MIRRLTTGLILLILVLPFSSSCRRTPTDQYQGYFEGEFIYAAAPSAGNLQHLHVKRGDLVAEGDLLFILDSTLEIAARAEGIERLREARARLQDLKEGQRPSELAALEAGLKKARTASELSEIELERARELVAVNAVPADQLDRARLTHEQNEQIVIELEHRLDTARLGGREGAIAAAAAEAEAAQARLTAAEWNLDQKTQRAPGNARVHDTLYVESEWVSSGRPVVMLLPPENIKVRFFVPEGDLGKVQVGNLIETAISGWDVPLTGRISYISTTPEYTPPVIYNRENRAKLVFMVEGTFDTETAETLHPGQPVDVRLAGSSTKESTR